MLTPEPRTLNPPNSLGFFTVVEYQPHGLFGGYLLLNAIGRPLEFHCTAPVKPSRAQQILYGPTLEPFLYGEQIGATLVNKSGQPPAVVLVDLPQALAVRQHIDVPTALVMTDENAATKSIVTGTEITVGHNRLLVPSRYAADQALIGGRLTTIEELFNLMEPFNRIREAIEEAQRSAAKAA